MSAYWLPFAVLVAVWAWPFIWYAGVRGRLQARVKLSRHELGQGDPLPFTVSIRNRSWFPCPFVQVVLDLPVGLSASPDREERRLAWTTYLLMRQEVDVQAVCYGSKRGVHSFVAASMYIRINDGLGLKEIYVSAPIVDEVAVQPAFISLAAAEPAMRELSGKIEILRWLHPDESLLRGIRDYQAGDSYRHLAWQASAREGKWMTKVFAASTESTVTLVLNAQFFDPYWLGTRVEHFDRLCEGAAAVAFRLEMQGFAVQFAANAVVSRDPKRMWHGHQRAAGVRSLLGRAHPYANGSLVDLLQAVNARAPRGGPLIVFSSFFSEPSSRRLQLLNKERPVTVILGPEPEGISLLRGLSVVSASWPASPSKGPGESDPVARAVETKLEKGGEVYA